MNLSSEKPEEKKPKGTRGGKRPGTGGARRGAGRPKGSREHATIEQKGTIAELARAYTPIALKTLVRVAETSQSDAACVSASIALLDRGYGRPAQAVEMTGKDGGPIQVENNASFDGLLLKLEAASSARAKS